MKVWLQRGHAFRRRGSTGTSGQGTTEQRIVDQIAQRAAGLLRGQGHTVTVALADERLRSGYDVFIALHCDGSVSQSASGASVGYRTAAGRAAGRAFKAEYIKAGWPYGFRDDNYTSALARYYGTGWAQSAGIRHAFILEFGFLTNSAKDGRWIVRNVDTCGRAVANTALRLAGGDPVWSRPEPEPPDEQDDVMDCTAHPQYARAGQRLVNRAIAERPDITGARSKLDVDGQWGPASRAAWRNVSSTFRLPDGRDTVITLGDVLVLGMYGVPADSAR